MKPNVILILADDMGTGDLSCFNGGLTRTPHLDQLVGESVFFDQAYSSAPVCAPARASMLTGRYPHRTGCLTLDMARFPELSRMKKSEVTMADIFRSNGYATGLVGKWHCGMTAGYLPLDRGFDEWEGFADPRLIETYFEYTLTVQDKCQRVNDQYLTEDLSARAVEYLRRHQHEPFFLHLAHYAPHRPLSAPDELVQEYRERGFGEKTAQVYAMIEIMDRGIGELLEALEKLKLRENTIIIFSSDNGPDPLVGERFNHELRGTKYTVFEGGIHVPFMMSIPGSDRRGICDELIHFTDILPTLADACQLSLPKNLEMDGGSFAPVFAHEPVKLPEYRVWQWNRGVPDYSHNAAIRRGGWKLIRPPVSSDLPQGESSLKPELFNLKKDPGEQADMAREECDEYDTLRVMLEQRCRELEFSRLSH